MPVRASIEPGCGIRMSDRVGSISCGAGKRRTRLRRAVRTTNLTEYSSALRSKQDGAMNPLLGLGVRHRQASLRRSVTEEVTPDA